jgi:hypothetical protein
MDNGLEISKDVIRSNIGTIVEQAGAFHMQIDR